MKTIALILIALLYGCASTLDVVRYKQDSNGNWVEDKDALPDCVGVTVSKDKGPGRVPACRFQ